MQMSDNLNQVRNDSIATCIASLFYRSASRVIRTTRMIVTAIALVLGVTVAGCTIPSDCGDLDYPTYGGAWQRTRRDSGRVGSIFDPAGARTATLSPKELPEGSEHSRSPGESILSAPPAAPGLGGTPAGPTGGDDPLLEPSPSDRLSPDRLRSLDLDDIDMQRGQSAPPDLN